MNNNLPSRFTEKIKTHNNDDDRRDRLGILLSSVNTFNFMTLFRQEAQKSEF